jgi:hypothetical protein
MFATIWMCTHEWSLISMRTVAFTFATCHQPFSRRSALTRSSSVRSFLFPRSGTRIRICRTACAGARRVSLSACSETGCSIRSSVCLSSAIHAGLYSPSLDGRRPPVR